MGNSESKKATAEADATHQPKRYVSRKSSASGNSGVQRVHASVNPPGAESTPAKSTPPEPRVLSDQSPLHGEVVSPRDTESYAATTEEESKKDTSTDKESGTLVGPSTLNPPPKYVLGKLLGTGAFAEAYLCTPTRAGMDESEYVAKIVRLVNMSEKSQRYARAEIRCLQTCHCFSIVRCIEADETPQELTIVLEYCDGGDLRALLKSQARIGPFPVETSMRYMIQLLVSIDYIHSRKMLHRDIKSANVFATTSGLLKLGDFGFSKQYDETVSAACARTFLGTPYYVAPELWSKRKYDKKADIWALGVLFYEIAALERPFLGSTVSDIQKRVLSGTCGELPAHVPHKIRHLIYRMLELQPSSRPSARDILMSDVIQEALPAFRDWCNTLPEHVRDVVNANLADAYEARDTSDGKFTIVPATSEDTSIFEGIVLKASIENDEVSWKSRYLQLHEDVLLIATTKEKMDVGRYSSLALDSVRAACVQDHPRKGQQKGSEDCEDFVWCVQKKSGTTIVLCSETARERKEWLAKINEVLGVEPSQDEPATPSTRPITLPSDIANRPIDEL